MALVWISVTRDESSYQCPKLLCIDESHTNLMFSFVMPYFLLYSLYASIIVLSVF